MIDIPGYLHKMDTGPRSISVDQPSAAATAFFCLVTGLSVAPTCPERHTIFRLSKRAPEGEFKFIAVC